MADRSKSSALNMILLGVMMSYFVAYCYFSRRKVTKSISIKLHFNKKYIQKHGEFLFFLSNFAATIHVLIWEKN